ncbi:tubulin monoglycylase TTLL3-like [Lineus longissimus]|uniref:tubulin monoglycylase TTLL3-like n=1 Tax=Lineus longissimus TaxID=88925 RepID=UPI00315D158B
MGKHKTDDDSDLTFPPKIGDRNRKLELLKIYGCDNRCLKNRWSGRSLTSRSDDRDARNYNGLLNLPGYMKSTFSKLYQESADVRMSVMSLAPLKRVPAKKLCLGTRLYKDNLDVKNDDVPCFTNFRPRLAEQKCARIHGATSKSAGGDEDQRRKPCFGRLSPVLSASEANKKSRQSVREDEGNRGPRQSVAALSTMKQSKFQLKVKLDDSLAWSSDDGENRARSTQSGTGLCPVRHESKLPALVRSSVEDHSDHVEGNDNEAASDLMLNRKIPQSFFPRLGDHTIPSVSADEVKNAQINVEKAIKHDKIFAIKGSWVIRKALKNRGWVEKSSYNWLPSVQPKKKKRRSSRDKTATNDLAVDVAKSDSIDGIMSRMVRNYSPSFIWCEDSARIDYRYLNKNQIVNHYERVGSFVTKVGLCKNLRNVVWFDNTNAMTFFPRCYELSMADEKAAFIDDFRLTACQSIIRHVIENYKGLASEGNTNEEKVPSQDGNALKKGGNKSGVKRKGKPDGLILPCMNCDSTGWTGSKQANSHACSNNSFENASSKPRKKSGAQVDLAIIDQAIQQCERWLGLKAHLDIDHWDDPHRPSDSGWHQILRSCHRIISGLPTINNAASRVEECELMADRLREHNAQFDMDGTRNVWIIKPGAQSQGKGILMSNNLDQMLKMSSDSAVKVVQKYIEHPLLVYNTKFDIRQWFLVTDWNPLTIWFYKECYLRFCSQEFSLGNFDKAIHLSNVAIQRHCSNGPRSKSLPVDNMWDLETFKQYLSRRGQGQVWAEKIYPGMKKAVISSLLSVQNEVKGDSGAVSRQEGELKSLPKTFSSTFYRHWRLSQRRGQGQVWADKIYPGMKKAVISSLLSVQDVVKDRKASFELYGADFMLTKDQNPWLIEINSSPDLSFSTPITKRMCRNVIEDTIKVVIDRKKDKSFDIGNFELAFKQNPVTVLPYFGTHLKVEGQGIAKPTAMAKAAKEELNLEGVERLFLHKQFLPNP